MNLDYFYTFTQTVVLEMPFYLWLLRGTRPLKDLVIAVIAINAFTHPIVFFGLMSVSAPPLYKIAVSEIFAPAFEAWAIIFFLKIDWRRACLASLIANFISWQVGPILTFEGTRYFLV